MECDEAEEAGNLFVSSGERNQRLNKQHLRTVRPVTLNQSAILSEGGLPRVFLSGVERGSLLRSGWLSITGKLLRRDRSVCHRE
jgi:hypothetical protein